MQFPVLCLLCILAGQQSLSLKIDEGNNGEQNDPKIVKQLGNKTNICTFSN